MKKIGEGCYGEVFEATGYRGNLTIAVKLIKFSKHSEAKTVGEAKLHARLDHPNIVKLYEFFLREGQLFMCMELAAGKILERYVMEKRKLSGTEADEIIAQLLSAIRYLHSQDVTHGDIHERNVIVDGGGKVKLIDFGEASRKDPFQKVCEKLDLRRVERLRSFMISGQLNPLRTSSLSILQN